MFCQIFIREVLFNGVVEWIHKCSEICSVSWIMVWTHMLEKKKFPIFTSIIIPPLTGSYYNDAINQQQTEP